MSIYEKKLWAEKWIYTTQANLNNATTQYVRYKQKEQIHPAALSMARWKFSFGRIIVGRING